MTIQEAFEKHEKIRLPGWIGWLQVSENGVIEYMRDEYLVPMSWMVYKHDIDSQDWEGYLK